MKTSRLDRRALWAMGAVGGLTGALLGIAGPREGATRAAFAVLLAAVVLALTWWRIRLKSVRE